MEQLHSHSVEASKTMGKMTPSCTSKILRILYSRIFSLVQNYAKSPLGPSEEIVVVLIFVPLGLDHAYFYRSAAMRARSRRGRAVLSARAGVFAYCDAPF